MKSHRGICTRVCRVRGPGPFWSQALWDVQFGVRLTSSPFSIVALTDSLSSHAPLPLDTPPRLLGRATDQNPLLPHPSHRLGPARPLPRPHDAHHRSLLPSRPSVHPESKERLRDVVRLVNFLRMPRRAPPVHHDVLLSVALPQRRRLLGKEPSRHRHDEDE